MSLARHLPSSQIYLLEQTLRLVFGIIPYLWNGERVPRR